MEEMTNAEVEGVGGGVIWLPFLLGLASTQVSGSAAIGIVATEITAIAWYYW